jgi:hypothetical protein
MTLNEMIDTLLAIREAHGGDFPVVDGHDSDLRAEYINDDDGEAVVIERA